MVSRFSGVRVVTPVFTSGGRGKGNLPGLTVPSLETAYLRSIYMYTVTLPSSLVGVSFRV